jgi:hypothetical protein
MKKLTQIHIIDNAHTEVTSEADPDDEWSRESTYQSHYIQGFEVAIYGRWGDVECEFEPGFDTPYFLLYYTYDTGDSFGSDEGLIEFVGFYKNHDLAIRSMEIINGNLSADAVAIVDDNGTEYKECLHQDYFGQMHDAVVQTVYRKG